MDTKTSAAAVLLMAASVFYRGRPPNSSPVTQANTNAPVSSGNIGNAAALSESGPWTPVCRYAVMAGNQARDNFGTSAGQKEKRRTLKDQFCLSEAPAASSRADDENHWHVTALIATIPNPELTHLSLMFDRYIESITWALADGDLSNESYSFDSYWFPWRSDQKEETDPEKVKSLEKERDQRSSTPGILLFRRNSRPNQNRPHPEKELLLVFLVGETPTSGINRMAFDKAWTYATELADRGLPICEAARGNSKSCIGILGPSFTGSLPSLRLLLNRDKRPGYETFVISGAVTGTTEDPSSWKFPAGTHFCTTIETEQYRWTVFRKFLTNLSRGSYWGAAGKDFALLAEDETDYGEAAGKPENPKGASARKEEPQESLIPLTLRFPRGIARLRNSSEDLAGVVNPARNTPYPELPLSLRDTGQDTLPSFSRQQSPVSQEAALIELGTALRRERIRFVGIVATDPLDVLFLTRAIHALSPNIRIFLFHSDLLFARASQNWGLSGVLAVTSYPLITRNQYYAGAVRPRRTQFANDGAEGEYNACRRMLLMAPYPSDSQPCSAAIHPKNGVDYLLDYAAPFANPRDVHKPSVWVTMLGRNEWWPVAALAANSESALLNGPTPGAHGKEQFSVEANPQPWFFFFWLTSIACALHVALVFGMNITFREAAGHDGRAHAKQWWEHSLLRRLAWDYDPDLARLRRGTLVAASLTVAFACYSLAAAVWASGLGGGQLWVALLVGIAAMAEALWVASGIDTWWQKLSWLGAVVIAATAAAKEIADASTAGDSYGHALEFAGYRAVHIESGTSPVLPVMILLLAIYLFCWLRLSRLRMEEERHAQPPTGEDAQAFPYVIPKDAVRELGLGQVGLVAAAVLAWLVFFNPLKALASVEGAFYDLILACLSSIVIFMFALVLIRFLVTWRMLRKLLQNLERHPLRYAFSRLPKDFSWTTIWAGDPRPQLIMPARSLDVLRLIPWDELRPHVDAIESAFGCFTQRDRDLVSVRNAVKQLNEALNKAFGLLSMGLRSVWREGVSDSLASREKCDEVPAEWKTDPLRIAAEEFLALRFVTVIAYALRIMRGFLEFVTYGFILLVVALAVYPFEGRRYIETAILFIFVVSGTAVGIVFAQMDRNPLLSRLSESKPNQLGIAFVYRLVSFGALPLLTLLASQVPDIGSFLLSWLQPALQSLK